MIETNKIHQGDCLDVMKEMDDNSVSSIVTDPPYGLSFMGKKWDYNVPSVEVWKECLRVLKPGGFLLSFAGTRTYHRMAVNIEDAGFEIRDMISWLYGSGFPKSLNIGKQVDKIQRNEREVIDKRDVGHDITSWEGWGTALKPACEPIVVARKPITEKNIALNVLKWGTGGINIDACRIGTQIRINKGMSAKQPECAGTFRDDNCIPKKVETKVQGRFPANIILDEEAGKILDEQSGISKSSGGKGKQSEGALGDTIYGKYNKQLGANAGGLGDKGGASRFFYCAKASKKERNLGLLNDEKNKHPTVKPIKLIQYLVKLVNPKNGIVLDPFSGSGTTGVACVANKMNFILIEKELEYVEIANKRIGELQAGIEIDQEYNAYANKRMKRKTLTHWGVIKN